MNAYTPWTIRWWLATDESANDNEKSSGVMPRLLPILYYHHVGVCQQPQGHRALRDCEERFGAQMAYLAGYRLACSMMRGNRYALADGLRLKRVPVDEFTSLERFRFKLSSIYDLTCRFRRWSRKMRRRSL